MLFVRSLFPQRFARYSRVKLTLNSQIALYLSRQTMMQKDAASPDASGRG